MKSVLFLILTIVITVLAVEKTMSNYEKFVTQKGELIYEKVTKIGEYSSPGDNKIIKFDLAVAKDDSAKNIKKALILTINKSKYSDDFDLDVIDLDEIENLVKSLKKMWNYKRSNEKTEIETVTIRTRTGLAIFLAVNEVEKNNEKMVNRVVGIATNEAYHELREIREERAINRVLGLSYFPLEGLKNIIEIFEKALQ